MASRKRTMGHIRETAAFGQEERNEKAGDRLSGASRTTGATLINISRDPCPLAL